MEEKKFIDVRKNEFNLKEFINKIFGKGRVSTIKVEYTPIGEKIIIATHKPGIIIGKKGEKLLELTDILKKKFNMENPHIDIEEITQPYLDPQLVADEIALLLERFGSIRFKAVCYRLLTKIKDAGALGAEIRVSGRLPSERAKTWPFTFGYLKKTGDASKVVDKAKSIAETKQGIIGIKVSILSPDSNIPDRFNLDEAFINKIKNNAIESKEKKEIKKKNPKK